MFESVGRTKKQDRRQQAGSLLLSLAVNGSFIGGLIWAGATVAEEVVEDLGRRSQAALLPLVVHLPAERGPTPHASTAPTSGRR